MDAETFGRIALDLLNQAQIPGALLEQALEFKQVADRMAGGKVALKEADNA